MKWPIRRRVPYIGQVEASDCAAAAIAMSFAYHRRPIALAVLHEELGTARDGVNMAQMVVAAENHGFRARAVHADLADLEILPVGTILHWDFSHFVVLERVRAGRAYLVDPAAGACRIPVDEVGNHFSGVALTVEPTEASGPQSRAWSIPRWAALTRVIQRRTLARVIVTSLLLRIAALALPLVTAALINRVIVDGDGHMLAVLTVGSLVVVVHSTLVTYLRSLILLDLRTRLDVSMTVGFLEHLVNLPFHFFLRHTAGDLMVRLRSNSEIRDVVTTGAVSAVLDGGFAVAYLVLIWLVSVPLGVLVTIFGALQVCVLMFSHRPNQRLMAQSLQAESRTVALGYQLLAGIETVKSAGAEGRVLARWADLFADEVNVAVRRGRLAARVDSLNGGLQVAAPLSIVLLGARQVLGGDLSLGTMLALAALATGFLLPLSNLVASGLQFQLLSSYLTRINDVLETHPERRGGLVPASGDVTGRIRAEHVRFRYQSRSVLVVDDISLDIAPREKVGIIGPSGCGKSTLARLLLGLYAPSGGRVLHDEVDLSEIDLHAARARLGVVTQDAQLFGVSIRQNIALSDPGLPLSTITRAARLACIHDDIVAMPLGYETPLLDRGLTLSGGQRQRIALARALARRPEVLLLDEATSALDINTEAVIHRNLSAELADATMIIISHRMSALANTDRSFVLEGGRLKTEATYSDLFPDSGVVDELTSPA